MKKQHLASQIDILKYYFDTFRIPISSSPILQLRTSTYQKISKNLCIRNMEEKSIIFYSTLGSSRSYRNRLACAHNFFTPSRSLKIPVFDIIIFLDPNNAKNNLDYITITEFAGLNSPRGIALGFPTYISYRNTFGYTIRRSTKNRFIITKINGRLLPDCRYKYNEELQRRQVSTINYKIEVSEFELITFPEFIKEIKFNIHEVLNELIYNSI